MTALVQASTGASSESACNGANRWWGISAVLLLLLSACQEDVPTQQQPFRSDSLWVAIVVKPKHMLAAGELIPIGQYYEGRWDRTWPEIFDHGPFASIDSIGGLSVARPILPPIDIVDPERLHIEAPRWWRFYMDDEEEDTLVVTDLALGRAHCVLRWVLSADLAKQVEKEESPGIVGVAFSRAVESISADVEIPNLDSIQASLGLVRRTPRVGDGFRNFVWLGFYQLEDGTKIGVVNDIGYEGEGYKIISFYGGRGQVVVDVHGGGC